MQNDTEYEYLYDDNETETFFVDLDLSTLTGAIKSRLRKTYPNRRGPQKPPPKKSAHPDAFDDDNSDDDNVPSPAKADPHVIPSEPPTPATHEQDLERNLQILDLDTTNPIVSYKGQMYSCSWTDMIGTNIFFTKPSPNQPSQPPQSHPDYSLLGTSHIKLSGQKAKLVPKPNSRKRARSRSPSPTLVENPPNEPDGSSFPGFPSNNWQSNIARRKQASFLDRLTQAKRLRGDKDIPTILSDRTTNTIYRLPKTTLLSAEEKLRIRNLNDRIVKGDARAVTSLKEIYSQIEDAAGAAVPTGADEAADAALDQDPI